jgi:predicted DNA-binding WGR domain protein
VSPTPSYGIARFKAYAHLVSIDPSKNRYRFYTLTWQPALFEGSALVRSWGRIGTSGRSRAIFFADQKSAQKRVEGILKRRLGHGYAVVRWE